MIGIVMALALMSSQATALPAATPAASAQPAAVRTEKLTPEEMKQLTTAKKAVADAEAKLAQAKRNLKGAEEGIEEAHHANTDCGCYLNTEGREYDQVEFKDDTIIIRHIHEAPPSLSPGAGQADTDQTGTPEAGSAAESGSR